MEEVIAFIRSFIESEEAIHKTRFNQAISESDQILNSDKIMRGFFHSIMDEQLSNYHRTSIDLTEKSLIKYRKPEKIKKRTLFKIESYSSFNSGDVIKRILKSNIIYRCYTDRDEKSKKPLTYSRSFFVADTDEGLKIVYLMRYVDNEWEHQHDYEPAQIAELGPIVEVRKFTPPEELTSLEDYNKE